MNGPQHLLDSNVDWGQDLEFLKTWIDDHPEAAMELKVAYFGVVSPRQVGINFQMPALMSKVKQEWAHGVHTTFPEAGYYAASVNLLYGMSYEVIDPSDKRVTVYRGDLDYLKDAERIGTAGYSIYLFHLRPSDVERLVEKMRNEQKRTPGG